MPDVLGTIAGVLSVASAVNGFSKAIADAVSKEDRRLAMKLAGFMSDIKTHACDIRSYPKRAAKVKGNEARESLFGLALEKTELMLLVIRNLIRVVTQIWFRPGIIRRFLSWFGRRSRKGSKGRRKD